MTSERQTDPSSTPGEQPLDRTLMPGESQVPPTAPLEATLVPGTVPLPDSVVPPLHPSAVLAATLMPGIPESIAPPPPSQMSTRLGDDIPIRARPSTSRRPTALNLPGYEILGELGRGGMGVVYKARQTRLKRLAAVKMILSGAQAGSQARARFLAEAEACARLHHPNIIQIYEIGEVDGNPYFSLEYVDGGALDGQLKGTPLAPEQAAELTRVISLAVHAAHEQGIVHRDLKPANVLLQRRSQAEEAELGQGLLEQFIPKITDFGLAKSINEGDSGKTQDGEVMGTPSYMAPEQATGRIRDIGPVTDVYALGAILYEFLSGKPPFRGVTALDTVKQVIEEEPIPLRHFNARVPRDLDIICARCLEKDARKRYPTALALADDLKRYLDGEPIAARATPRWERAWRWARKHPTTAALSGVGCLLAVVLVAGLVWFNRHLRHVAAEARAEATEARSKEEAANTKQRLTQLRLEAQTRLQAGRAALASGDIHNAQLSFGQVLASIEKEEELSELRQETETLLAEARQRVGDADGIRQARERLKQLARHRDDALFYASSFTGLDLASSLRATQEAARKGLALYGLGDNNGQLALGSFLTPAQKEDIVEGCYELLLILADATAAPLATTPAAVKRRQALDALERLAQAEKLGRSTQALHRRRARYLDQAGRADEAAQERATAEKIQASTALDVFLVGEDRLRHNQLRDAEKDFERVLRLKPDHFWAQYFLAVSQLRQSPERAPEARAHLTACLGRRDFLWAYLLRGFANGEAKDYAAAEADYQEALARKPDTLALYGLHVNRGVIRVRQQHMTGAVDDFQKAIALRPNDVQAYANLADALRRQGDSREALALLDKAVTLKPDMPALYRVRSGLRRELGDKGSALDDLKRAAGAEQVSRGGSAAAVASDRVAQAKLHLEAKRYTEAVAACDLALEAAADHVAAQRWKAEALLGLKRYAEAVECFTHYLERGKPSHEVYRARGLARAKLGRHPEAIDDLTSALRLKADAELHAARGWIYLVCQAPKLAHYDFDRAVTLEPRHADALNGRAFAAAQLGQVPEAVSDANRALELGPESPRHVYNTARVFAQVSVGRSDYHERALQLVQRALTLTPVDQRAAFWKQYVLTDAAMTPLRNGIGFTRLREVHGLAN